METAHSLQQINENSSETKPARRKSFPSSSFVYRSDCLDSPNHLKRCCHKRKDSLKKRSTPTIFWKLISSKRFRLKEYVERKLLKKVFDVKMFIMPEGMLLFNPLRVCHWGEKASEILGVEQNFAAIRKNQELFEDSTFPTDTFHKDTSGEEFFSEVSWKRPKEVCKSPEFYTEGNCFLRGAIDTSHLINALTILTKNQHLLKAFMPMMQGFKENYKGAFHFRFWHFGRWVDVVIDDRLPVLRNQLVSLRSDVENEFWAPLLEKAYAKFLGSYEALETVTFDEVLADLTAAIVEYEFLSDHHFCAISRTFECALGPGNLLGLMTRAQSESEERTTPEGLALGKAYLVNKVVTLRKLDENLETVRLLRIKSDGSSWNGCWSNGSTEWQQVPECKRKELGLTCNPNTEFWMCLEDVIKYFERYFICHMNSVTAMVIGGTSMLPSRIILFEGSWVIGSTSGGCINESTFYMNHKYQVHIMKTSYLLISLTQKSHRRPKSRKYPELNIIGCTLFKMAEGKPVPKDLPRDILAEDVEVIKPFKFSSKRSVVVSYYLQSGTYFLVPSTYHRNIEGRFLLAVYGDYIGEIKELESGGVKQADKKAECTCVNLLDLLGVDGIKDANEECKIECMDEEAEDSCEEKGEESTMACIQEPVPILQSKEVKAFRKEFGIDQEIDWVQLKIFLPKAMENLSPEDLSDDLCRNLVFLNKESDCGKINELEFYNVCENMNKCIEVFNLHDKSKEGKIKARHLQDALMMVHSGMCTDLAHIAMCRFRDEDRCMGKQDFLVAAVRILRLADIFEEFPNPEVSFSLKELVNLTINIGRTINMGEELKEEGKEIFHHRGSLANYLKHIVDPTPIFSYNYEHFPEVRREKSSKPKPPSISVSKISTIADFTMLKNKVIDRVFPSKKRRAPREKSPKSEPKPLSQRCSWTSCGGVKGNICVSKLKFNTYKWGESGCGLYGQLQDFIELKTKHLENASLFEDDQFSTDFKSLNYTSPDRSSYNTIEWIRPMDICKNCTFYKENVFEDLSKGRLGNIWFLAAVATLRALPKILVQVVPTTQYFNDEYAGIFSFRFFHFGKWLDIVVDDRLPMESDSLVYTSCTEDEQFWVPLLEKAYAKFRGCYESIEGTMLEILEDMTGNIVEELILTEQDPTTLHEVIKDAVDSGVFLYATVECNPDDIESTTAEGFSEGHVYHLIKYLNLSKCKDSEPITLLLLRNPRMVTSYEGPWNINSKEWKDYTHKELQRSGALAEEEGSFWITYHDFLASFSNLYIWYIPLDCDCTTSKTIFRLHQFNDEWVQGTTSGGSCEFSTFADNPQYMITVPSKIYTKQNPAKVVVSLMQKNRRRIRPIGVTDQMIGITLLKIRDMRCAPRPLTRDFLENEAAGVAKPKYGNSREVTARYYLSPGHYCLIVSTQKRDVEAEYFLRIYCKNDINLGIYDADLSLGEPFVTFDVHCANVENSEEAQKQNDENLGCACGNVKKVKGDILKGEELSALFWRVAGEKEYINCLELQKILQDGMSCVSTYEAFTMQLCRKLLSLYDNDRLGKLEFQEFLELWKDVAESTMAFVLFDPDMKNSINFKQLRYMLRFVGIDADRSTLNTIARNYGNENHVLCYAEFLICVSKLKYAFSTYNKGIKRSNKKAFIGGAIKRTLMYA